jgi:DNA end-binding protein Ku
MARAIWKGSITFGLVEIPVGLVAAEESNDLAFHQIDKRTFARVGTKRINKETGEEVAWEDIVRGYEYEPDEYVVLTDEELAKANTKATQTIEIEDFVDQEEIDPVYFEKPYYLEPIKKGSKSYALLRETLVRTGKVGVATVVIRTRQHLAAVYAVDKYLVLNTLRYATELRDPSELKVPDDLKEAKVTPRELDMAERLVEDMEMTWDPTQFHDTYRDDLLKLIEEKAQGKTRAAPKAKAQKEAKVIDFAELLERSLGSRKKAANDEDAGSGKKAAAAKTRRKATTKTQHRKAA